MNNTVSSTHESQEINIRRRFKEPSQLMMTQWVKDNAISLSSVPRWKERSTSYKLSSGLHTDMMVSKHTALLH